VCGVCDGEGEDTRPSQQFQHWHWHWHGFSTAVHHENHNTSETERMVNLASAFNFCCLTPQLFVPSIASEIASRIGQTPRPSDSSCQRHNPARGSQSELDLRSTSPPCHLIAYDSTRAGKGNAHTFQGREIRKRDGIRKTPPASRFSLLHK
jgi:hypothetical protein